MFPTSCWQAGGLEAADLGHPHLAGTHKEVLLDQSGEKATHVLVRFPNPLAVGEPDYSCACQRSFQEYERLLGLHLHSEEKSPWEVACTWLKTDQVLSLTNCPICILLNTDEHEDHRRHGEHFLRSKSSCCTSEASSQSADPGILLQSSLSVTAP